MAIVTIDIIEIVVIENMVTMNNIVITLDIKKSTTVHMGSITTLVMAPDITINITIVIPGMAIPDWPLTEVIDINYSYT